MTITDLSAKFATICKLGIDIARLPVARLHFISQPNPDPIRSVYCNFVKPHPKYKIFKNKSIGAAIIDLRRFASGEIFLESLRTVGRAPAERRRALARGHTVRDIDRNHHIDAIHSINISSTVRQGRPMEAVYLQKQTSYDDVAQLRCYGVFNGRENLVGYCNVVTFGNFALLDRVIGFKNQDGSMCLLITEVTSKLVEAREVNFLMYDMTFGAAPGLRDFKRKLGFRPYRANYTIE